MAHFRCLIRGEGFPGILEGRVGTVGFYVNRPVEAENAQEARLIVLEAFESELASRGWAGKGGVVVVDEIDEIEASELASIGQGLVIFPDTDGETAKADLQTPFLLIQSGGFSVNAKAPSEPWMMTETAMIRFRKAVCFDGAGTTCTIVDVVPLRAPTLRERMFPWRQHPVRLVLRAGPDLSLDDVRNRLIATLQADGEIADFVKMPVDEALRRLREAATPMALIEAAEAILNTR